MDNNELLAILENSYLKARTEREKMQQEAVKQWSDQCMRPYYKSAIKRKLNVERAFLAACIEVRLDTVLQKG